MPSPVPTRPSPAALASRRVLEPVSSAHGRRWSQELNHLRAYSVSRVADVRLAPYTPPATETSDVWLLYRRTPGVQVLRVSVTLIAPQGSAGTLSLRAGATPSLAVAASDEAPLGPSDQPWDGASSLALSPSRSRALPVYVAYFDVSSWPSTLLCLRVRYTGSSGKCYVVGVAAHEVALASVDPSGAPSSEPGCNEAEPDVRNRIYRGAGGAGGGLGRIFEQLDAARSEVRRHMQITARSTDRFTRDSLTMGTITWAGLTTSLALRMRARSLYGTAGINRHTFAAIYFYSPTYTTDLTLSKIRASATTIGLGGATAATPADVALTNTVTNPAVGTATLDLPCDGTDQAVEISFGAQTSNTDGVSTAHNPVYIYALALIENES